MREDDMKTHDLHETVTTVYLQGDAVVLEEFRETDPDVVAFVREAEDRELAVHRCLEMGARALRLAGATLDSQLVEHRFGEMTGELGRSVDEFAKRVDESAEKLLGEESGELTTALTAWLDEVTRTLDATFDESSKKSAIAKLENVLRSAREEQVESMRLLLDPANAGSPLATWRTQIVETVEKQGREIEKAIGELREKVVLEEAVAAEAEKGTQKGRTFEHVVLDEVTEIIRHLEDTVEHTGDLTGASGKVGDLVVKIDPRYTPGRSASYVIEVKDKALSQKDALAELEAAMANRDADAGIIVFARAKQCPVKAPFQWFDHKALVVLDKDELDPLALRLACAWARWTATREAVGEADTVDTVRILGLLDDVRLSLRLASAVKGSHTKAKTAIAQAGQQLDEMTAEIAAKLTEIDAEVSVDAG
jgi:hypothetical protein